MFALGAVVGVTIASLIRSKDREEFAKEMREHAKIVETRLAVQVEAMAMILQKVTDKSV